MKEAPKQAKECAAWAFARSRKHPEIRPGHRLDARIALDALVADGWIRTKRERDRALDAGA